MKPLFPRGLALRLSALVLTGAGAVFVSIVLATYFMAREALLHQAEANARNFSQALVNHIESVLAPIPKIAQGMAYDMEYGDLAEADIFQRQRRLLQDNEALYGTAVAFEPEGRRKGQLYYAPYTFRTPLGPKATFLGGPDYRYHGMDWYQIPREMDRIEWSEPYYDEGGGDSLMATCSVPFHRVKDGKQSVAGVVTADVSLEWLKRLVAGTSVLDTGYAYLITRTGTYVTHPASGVAYNESIFSRAEAHQDQALRQIGQDMIRGGSKFLPQTSLHSGKQGFLVYAPLPSTGWSLGVFYPRDELLASVHTLALVSAALGGGGFLALAVLIAFIARGITRPLRRLTVAARDVAEGNLDAQMPELGAKDEVRELAESFGHMQTSLRDYIRDLTQATASRERMESELRIAHDIQMGILPKIFPPFPNRSEIDLFASLVPAREVGGDFYDFFPCGEDQFCFLIGDVSGKGVPAAFYMAVAKTLIKAVAESARSGEQRRTDEQRITDEQRKADEGRTPGMDSAVRARRGADPGRILTRASNDLAQDNESCMFVTIFCAVLNMNTGEVRYASAGHNPPVLLRAGGVPEYLPTQQEPVAGAMEGVVYTTDTLILAPGDGILLYTDGVTEAMNPDLALYGEDRLLEQVAARGALEPKALCEHLGRDILSFASGAEQSDDITMLALRYLGSGENAG
ncbi:MAG: SpoIIE family protein phosphatase [Humidesulfovibrio sp.]|uniref:SpoIIE family protein phosphatase n=1 Tax=Humidesulfovibrio sp. TaxID=2910988 RepID=UPI002734F4D4|nr:SpoIIE family protein phosphatase [Humidesulfovibrio sp.]MDP2849398.1 SpoIIE family protein phosphatase [Humidesulfovibrio sp.]